MFWGLLVLTLALRSAAIDRPLLGNFATKNVFYAMIARNWAEGRSGMAYPMVDCLTPAGRSLYMQEFPAAAYLTGWLWKVLGGSLDIWGRATGVAFSTASVVLLFLFVRRRHGDAAALGAGFVLAVSPVSIIYGQSFMLQASLVTFTLATFYALDRWLSGAGRIWLPAAAVFLALTLLTKVYMLVLLVPLAATVLLARRGFGPPTAAQSQRPRYAAALLAAALAIAAAASWYWHAAAAAAPDGPLADRIFYSIRHSVFAHRTTHTLLGSPDFYRQLLDDLTGVVLTPVGFMLAVAGLLHPGWRYYLPWLLAMLVLIAALPLKFYEMNYYYMAVLPPLGVMVGLGWEVIHERLRPGRTAVAALLFLALLLSLRHAVRPAFVTPDEDRGVLPAARAIKKLTAPSEPVITMHGTTIDLLYYCDRPGWAVAPGTPQLASILDDCRRRGARYLVVAGPAAATSPPDSLRAQTPIVRGDGFCIYKLATAGREKASATSSPAGKTCEKDL